jgi:hypothetical protein
MRHAAGDRLCAGILYFLRQDYPNKELLIVDDGTDRSPMIPEDRDSLLPL